MDLVNGDGIGENIADGFCHPGDVFKADDGKRAAVLLGQLDDPEHVIDGNFHLNDGQGSRFFKKGGRPAPGDDGVIGRQAGRGDIIAGLLQI